MADWSDFPWRPGMLNTYGWRVRSVRADGVAFAVDGFPAPSVRRLAGDDVPDLTDPTTVGALAGAVREAWVLPDLYAKPLLTGGWTIMRLFTPPTSEGPDVWALTEGEAWLAAWQARPKERA